ncbi:MAG: SusC/RagA family TonB-linked outer membrane protein [Cytophagales bacterium]|nr:MAG: SusC/RagA family TonB-linked outer membrane protein [Cytophagales bacterium]
MKRLLLVGILSVFFFGYLSAQDRTISGTVTSGEDKSTLPGVNVVAKGTNVGVITDMDGKYKLSVPAGVTKLLFSFVGFTSQEVEIGNQTTIDIALAPDTKQLSEIVVTAIGIQREKKALGYAVANLGGEKMQQISEPDAVRGMQGKMAGVNIQGSGGAPGQSTKINIRGNSSLTGNTQPLFVVDGIPFDNQVSQDGNGATAGAATNTQSTNRAFDIDPNNIESMTVLKGAAAAALYGSRATNGVIVITTKASKKKTNKGLEVTFNSSASLEKIAGIPVYQDVYGQGSNQVYNGGFIGNWGSPFAEYVDQINSKYGTNYSKVIVPGYPEGTVPHPMVGIPYTSARYRGVFPEFLDANGNAIPVPYKPNDIVGGFFQDGYLVENSLNVASGTEKGSMVATVSRMTNEGIMPGSKSSRTNLSFGGQGALANGLIVAGNVNYVNTTVGGPPSAAGAFADYGTAGAPSIYSRLFYLPRNFDLNNYPFENPADQSNVFYRALDNPRWLAKYASYNSNVNRVYGNMTLSYDVLPWLNLVAKGGVNTYAENRRIISPRGGVFDALGTVITTDLGNTEMDYNFIATASKDFTEDLGLRAIVGYNMNQRDYYFRSTRGANIISTGLNLTNSTSSQFSDSDFKRKQRFYAVYTDISLTYKDYLFFNFVARNDWTSTLPQGSNSYFYPGASVSFVLSEALGIESKWLNYAKLRASITKVGNEPRPYLTSTFYNINQPFTTAGGSIQNQASLSNTLGNPNLKPEFTTETEFGGEFKLVNSRVNVDITYFNRTSTQQLVQSAVAPSSGFTSYWTNAGEIQNKGWEIGLDLTPVQLDNGFRWNMYAAFTRIRSLVKDAGPAGQIIIEGFGINGVQTIHKNGEQYGQIFAPKNARDASGNLLINPNDGLPFILPQSDIVGNPNPNFLLGITNTLSWKGISLSALLDWKQGGQMYSFTAASLLLRGQLKGSEDREALRVIPGVLGNTATYEPLLGGDGQPIKNTIGTSAFASHFSNGYGAYGAAETNIYDVTTIRLRELRLSYEFPKSILSKTPFGSARISFSGRNLWWKSPNMLKNLNFDPEVLAQAADSNVQGFDLGATPTTRRYGVNLTVTF